MNRRSFFGYVVAPIIALVATKPALTWTNRLWVRDSRLTLDALQQSADRLWQMTGATVHTLTLSLDDYYTYQHLVLKEQGYLPYTLRTNTIAAMVDSSLGNGSWLMYARDKHGRFVIAHRRPDGTIMCRQPDRQRVV